MMLLGVLTALLAVVWFLRTTGVERVAALMADAFDDTPVVDRATEARLMAEARRAPTWERIQLLVQLTAMGSREAEGELDLWLAHEYTPGRLTPGQIAALDRALGAATRAEARRALAKLLLREADAPGARAPGAGENPDAVEVWRVGLAAAAGVPRPARRLEAATRSPDPALRHIAWRAAARLGDRRGMGLLLGALLRPVAREDMEALAAAFAELTRANPQCLYPAVGSCVELLGRGAGPVAEGALKVLTELTDHHIGPDQSAWADWWASTQETLHRLGGVEPGACD